MSTLQPHQQRVVDEKRELDGKLTKLKAFMGSPIAATIDDAEKGRLFRQAIVMGEYSRVLGERIEAFGSAA